MQIAAYNASNKSASSHNTSLHRKNHACNATISLRSVNTICREGHNLHGRDEYPALQGLRLLLEAISIDM